MGAVAAGTSGVIWTDGCEARITLTAAEERLLAALPIGGVEVEPVLWCGLEYGHSGLHWGLGQVSEDDWWWLRWEDSGERRELVHRCVCHRTAGLEDLGEPDVPCVLPTGHVGTCSYTRPA